MARIRRDLFRFLEAALVGLFFVQAVYFLYGTLYAHVASANLLAVTANPASVSGMPGVVDPQQVRIEIIVTAIAFFAPLLSFIFNRVWFGPALLAIVAAAGRVFICANGTTMIGVVGAAVTAGAGALYLATLAVRRPGMMPVCIIAGIATNQLIRLYGDTMDITTSVDFLTTQTVISLVVFGIAVLSAIFERLMPKVEGDVSPRGEISGWSAFAFGGLLYLEFALLGLPNSLAHRAGVEYITVAPWLVIVTLLPLVPEVRNMARRFLGMFDGQFRGWVWFLLIGLLLVLGFRFNGPIAAAALVIAQLIVSLSWWWVVQPADEGFNFTSLAVIFGLILFLLLTGTDYFTYEYAFVRNIPESIASLLRQFRGLGLVVALFATLLSGLPAILARKRLPWQAGRLADSLAGLAIVVAGGVLAVTLSRPVVAMVPAKTDQLRIATLNLHGGYSLYFNNDLPGILQQLRPYDANVILLQEVETGRLISYGVDQAAWLARQLNMQVVYYATNEGNMGLAVLSRLPILESQGRLLTSLGQQTGVQFLRLRAPDQAELHVYNTQLGLLLRGTDQSLAAQEADQTQQIQEIFGFMAEHDPNGTNRTLMGGTFNNVPNSDIYNYIAQQGFNDPFSSLPTEKAVTIKLANGRTERIDYLWVRHITWGGVGVGPIEQSTHNIAVIEIGLLQSTGG